jgi:hypothetical protein
MNVVSAAFTTYMQLEKAAETTFVRKICTFNVDEIDTKSIFCSPQMWGMERSSHSPHSNGHSPHVVSGEWVGQRFSRPTLSNSIFRSPHHYIHI